MSVSAGPDFAEDGLVLYLDAGNKKSYSPNEFQFSTDIYGWTTSATRATLSRDTISSPVGNTPLKMQVTGNDPYTNSYNSATWNIAPALAGQRWIVSAYAKASQNTNCEIFIFGANSSGVGFVDGSWLNITAKNSAITTEWTRVSHFIDFTNANVAFIHTRLNGTPSGGDGITIWWDGLQVERVPAGVTQPTPFSSLYQGGSNILNISSDTGDGIISGYPTFSDSQNGSMIFDGVNDFITVPQTILSSSASTISGWVYIDDFNTGKSSTGRTFIRGASNFTSMITFYNGGYSFESDTNSNPHEISGRTTGNVSSSKIVAGSWFYFTLVFNNSTFYGYVNGEPTGSAAISNGLTFNKIGDGTGFATSYPAFFKGKISNLSVYNRALSETEVKKNFNALRGRFGI
mgnify:CR=1 FL=1